MRNAEKQNLETRPPTSEVHVGPSGLISTLVSLYYDSSRTLDSGGLLNHRRQLPGSKQAQVRISSQANKIPWNMEQSTETPKRVCTEPAWVHQDLLVQTLPESSCTAKLALETAEMLTWHSTWTNKLLVLSWICSRPNLVPVYPQNS